VILVAGIFAGAMLWRMTLVAIATYFRNRFDDRPLLWMDRIAGLAIGGFGGIMLLLARHSRG
jgi:hypothetical protein